LENTEENSEKIGKIWKKIMNRFGKYRRNINTKQTKKYIISTITRMDGKLTRIGLNCG
jgi:hypothetical protein